MFVLKAFWYTKYIIHISLYLDHLKTMFLDKIITKYTLRNTLRSLIRFVYNYRKFKKKKIISSQLYKKYFLECNYDLL